MRRGAFSALLSGLVCPGAGQLYNKEYVKGGILLALSLGVLAAVAFKTWAETMRYVSSMPPQDLLADIIPLARKIIEDSRAFYDRMSVALAVVWAYAVFDAWRGGRKIEEKERKG
ncbi:MAG TPA: hypothetical protein VJM83_02490 [Nitrospirota bacterium]|nr:hypothetical protein [Nitrospirota bacterium]